MGLQRSQKEKDKGVLETGQSVTPAPLTSRSSPGAVPFSYSPGTRVFAVRGPGLSEPRLLLLLA